MPTLSELIANLFSRPSRSKTRKHAQQRRNLVGAIEPLEDRRLMAIMAYDQIKDGVIGYTINSDAQFVAYGTGNVRSQPYQVIVLDRQSGTEQPGSTNASGEQANARVFGWSLSDDGRYLEFTTAANNLVANDTNGQTDVFVKDLQTGLVNLASASSSGVQGNLDSNGGTGSISGNGRFVVFSSNATNLVENDTNEKSDVFVKDLQTGTLTRASVNSSGVEGDNLSYDPTISADGHLIAFTSLASNFAEGDTNGKFDIYVRDLNAGTTIRASLTTDGEQLDQYASSPKISASGNRVVFIESFDSFRSQVVVKDLTTGVLTRADVVAGQDVVATSYNDPTIRENGTLDLAVSISADGRYVVFNSAQNITGYVSYYISDTYSIYLKDLETGKLTRLSNNLRTGTASSYNAGFISSDGSYAVLSSNSYLVGLPLPPDFPDNHPPELDPNAPPATPFAIPEDTVASYGTPVWMFANSFMDADPGAARGIAIQLLGNNGSWQFTLDGGTSWQALKVGTLLPANANLSRVRFIPNPDFNGKPIFRYYGWDQTQGVAGTVVPLEPEYSSRGGWSAYSLQYATSYFTVTPVNDAPVLNFASTLGLYMPEDARNPSGFSIGQLASAISEVDQAAKMGVAITYVDSRNGRWEYTLNNGGAWQPLTNVSLSSALLLRYSGDAFRVRYIPSANYVGYTKIGYFAWDTTQSTNGGRFNLSDPDSRGGTTAFSVAWRNIPVQVYNVNDRPQIDTSVAAPLNSIEANNHNSYGTVISQLINSFSDPDSNTSFGLAITAVNNSHGLWQYTVDGGITWPTISNVSTSNALLLTANGNLTRVRFVPNLEYVGKSAIGYVAWDRTAGSEEDRVNVAGGGATSAYSVQSRISYISVNR